MEKNNTGHRSKRKSGTSPARHKKKVNTLPKRQTPKRKKNDKLQEKQSPSYKQQTLDSFVKKVESSTEKSKAPDSVAERNGRLVRRSPRIHNLQQATSDISKQPMEKQAKQTVKEPAKKNLKQSPKQPMKEPSKQALEIASKQAMRETILKTTRRTLKREQSNSERDQPSKKKRKEINSLYYSPSKKLDKLVPKVEDIMRSIKEENKFKQIQELIDKSSQKFFNKLQEKKVDENEKIEEKKVYDCKHLTQKTLERTFIKNAEFLDNIFHGKVYNERHELFKQDSLLNNFTDNDLRVNETTSVFTDEQLIYIVSLFRNKYDNGNIYKYSDYYFKVLLPEFCLKIFMDYHYQFKTKEVAMEYLKSLPVPKIL